MWCTGSTYPDHSFPHGDLEGTSVGTSLSHDHRTHLAGKYTSSHSLLRRYLGHTLETRPDKRKFTYHLKIRSTTQGPFSEQTLTYSASWFFRINRGISASMLTFLARVALVTRFADTGAIATVTLQSILLDAQTLLRTAGSKGPLRTSWEVTRKWRRKKKKNENGEY